MNSIIQFDQRLFLWIQHHLHGFFLDALMPWMRNKYSWYPLYVVVIIVLVYRYHWVGVKMMVVAVMCVILSDIVSSRIAKPLFHRLRPCEEPTVARKFTPIMECGDRGFSFTSSHAANHFALAFALGLFFFKRHKWSMYLAIAWAGGISFAQVYVGLHYPLDILGGSCIGLGIAYGVHWIKNKYFKKYFYIYQVIR